MSRAAEALGQIGDSRAVEPLIAALGLTGEVSSSAASALGQIGGPRAVEALFALLEDPKTDQKHFDLRARAIRALERLGAPVDKQRATVGADPSAPVRLTEAGQPPTVRGVPAVEDGAQGAHHAADNTVAARVEGGMSIIMHCFREPRDAERYFERFCHWARSASSTLSQPITVEIGVLLHEPLHQAGYDSVRERMQEVDHAVGEMAESEGTSVDGARKDLWTYAVGKGAVPEMMFLEAVALEGLELIDAVPFPFAVAYVYSAAVIPQEIINTEVRTDSYGTYDRLRDYLSRRWMIEQQTYGADGARGEFRAFPSQDTLFQREGHGQTD